jgi:LmbE family N-acetylglucosaminyl deacetylase
MRNRRGARGVRAIMLALAFLLSIATAHPAAAMRAQLERPHSGERIVIIAPHVDDEALAAAGYATDALEAGASVFVVYLTAGDHSRTASAANRLTFFATAALNRKGERRLREGRLAAVSIGLDPSHLLVLGYPDRGLLRMLLRPSAAVRSTSTGKNAVPYPEAFSPGAPYRLDSIMADLSAIMRAIQPDVVIAPALQDQHPDHRAAAILVSRVLHDLSLTHDLTGAPLRLGYVIHTGTLHANRALPVANGQWVVYPLDAETLRHKRIMLSGYRSQHRSPYLHTLFARSLAAQELFLRYDG